MSYIEALGRTVPFVRFEPKRSETKSGTHTKANLKEAKAGFGGFQRSATLQIGAHSLRLSVCLLEFFIRKLLGVGARGQRCCGGWAYY
jgi:hypothetical protein